ncbi:hypothetical protein [Halolamina sp. CBA1230]|nr:hypothetical protein [Halolamina sp. CBA1230]
MYLKNTVLRADLAERLEASKPIKRSSIDINTDIEIIDGGGDTDD